MAFVHGTAGSAGREHELRQDIADTAAQWVDGWDGSSQQDSSAYTARLYNSLDELRRWRTGHTHASDIPSHQQPRQYPRQVRPNDNIGPSLPLRASQRQKQPTSSTAVIGHNALSTFNHQPISTKHPLTEGPYVKSPHFDRFSAGPPIAESARATHGTDDFLRPSALLTAPRLAQSHGVGEGTNPGSFLKNPRIDLEKRKFRLRSTRQMFEDELRQIPTEEDDNTNRATSRSGSRRSSKSEQSTRKIGSAGTANEDIGLDSNGQDENGSQNSKTAATSASGATSPTGGAEDDGWGLDDLLLGGVYNHRHPSGGSSIRVSGSGGGQEVALSYGVASGLVGSGEVPIEQYFRSVVLNIRKQARKENADKTRKYKQQFEEKLEALTEKSNKQIQKLETQVQKRDEELEEANRKIQNLQRQCNLDAKKYEERISALQNDLAAEKMRNRKQKSAQVEVMWEREIEISRRNIAEERRRTAEQQKSETDQALERRVLVLDARVSELEQENDELANLVARTREEADILRARSDMLTHQLRLSELRASGIEEGDGLYRQSPRTDPRLQPHHEPRGYSGVSRTASPTRNSGDFSYGRTSTRVSPSYGHKDSAQSASGRSSASMSIGGGDESMTMGQPRSGTTLGSLNDTDTTSTMDIYSNGGSTTSGSRGDTTTMGVGSTNTIGFSTNIGTMTTSVGTSGTSTMGVTGGAETTTYGDESSFSVGRGGRSESRSTNDTSLTMGVSTRNSTESSMNVGRGYGDGLAGASPSAMRTIGQRYGGGATDTTFGSTTYGASTSSVGIPGTRNESSTSRSSRSGSRSSESSLGSYDSSLSKRSGRRNGKRHQRKVSFASTTMIQETSGEDEGTLTTTSMTSY